MEVVLKNVVTLSITLQCSYQKAIDYLSNPMNQKEWAIHFYQEIEEIDGRFIVTLPFGKVPLEIKSDFKTGVVDIYLGGKPICTRLIEIEENLCIYNFTLAQPEGMPNEVWENKALADMKDEMNNLKVILEQK